MAIIEGQVETLKKLKESLAREGITRFNSTGDINRFLQNYEAEKKALPTQIERELQAEIDDMQAALLRHQRNFDDLKTHIRKEIIQEIQDLDEALEDKRAKSERSIFFKILYFVKIKLLSRRRSTLQKDIENIIEQRTRPEENSVSKLKSRISYLQDHRKDIVAERSQKSLKELSHTKRVVDELYSLIAGAIGEVSVVKALEQLSDDFYVINDFSIRFHPPIYNRKENDRIHSIQVDHLLICQSGLFLLETKNWSKSSVESLDLRSPVEQILRTSYALFVLLNSDSQHSNVRLERHHWGAKKIPIRNVIVLTNQKPREEFKHVKLLSIPELIGYINYFDNSLSPNEVRGIFEYLKGKM